ncbi:hypothetical protein AN958_00548 [Leucoagaricus sp. SymC.cos]|nr:hypothetical protein AN958_00548 [Leucoagaricus sp. SymC.cos]
MLSHTGLFISLISMYNAVKSLSEEVSSKLKAYICILKTSFIYDNFNIALLVVEPIAQCNSLFISAISTIAIPFFEVKDNSSLCCSTYLWEKDPNNQKVIFSV